MLELRHLRALIALAETGNLSKAAKRVNLSQPAMSHQLKLIEDFYGSALFERKSVPLRLTIMGHRLLTLAYQVNNLVQDGERDVKRIGKGEVGKLRIAVECHSCFDWLMPSMDIFREQWAEIELDLVSGFHADPEGLIKEDRADLVIVSRKDRRPDLVYHPLFRYEVLGLLARHHPLTTKSFLTAKDFSTETLVTYPIPDDRLDLIREVLGPAKISPTRRTTELTVAILQLVASRRGVAALPNWAVQPYVDKGYVVARKITSKGLWSALFAATSKEAAKATYMEDFLRTVQGITFSNLKGVTPF